MASCLLNPNLNPWGPGSCCWRLQLEAVRHHAASLQRPKEQIKLKLRINLESHRAAEKSSSVRSAPLTPPGGRFKGRYMAAQHPPTSTERRERREPQQQQRDAPGLRQDIERRENSGKHGSSEDMNNTRILEEKI
ncbi:unnamed protein product [Pleuronectes platessa]|uniref:Uncharacterized protein n=1 Tax=Pleuronectes platessa TaxID=8262 RepID=A0A9N7YZZ8_PLEPL|nr:unnamed protein product [Pleuronectes platessa]